ncbi:HD family phosphohydrolase [Bacteroides ilei]|uniref:HD family phosphohydrolase n=1 Tax=Bacteroides ilei TaxID=1907658 RepID=UPI003AB89F7C
MRSFQSERQFSYKELLYKCVIFIATVAVIVYFLPREGTFNYQFDINKPWKYGLLQAPFEFPIYKGDAEMQREQDSIMTGYTPYYQLSAATGEKVIKQFRNDYANQLHRIIPNPAYMKHIERTLRSFYSQGIIKAEELGTLQTQKISNIQVVNENTSSKIGINNLYTTKRAYQELISSDTVHYNKTLLQRCNLVNYLTPNLTYDKDKSEAAKNELLSSLSWANGFVMNGQKIIDRGEIIDQHTYDILTSLQKEWEKRSETVNEKRLTLLGQILFVSLLIGSFVGYLQLFRRDYFQKRGSLTLLFCLIIFFTVISAVIVEHSLLSIYIVPYAMMPIIIRIFLDSRTAFMAHVVTILLCSITLRTPHEFILLQITAGSVGIYSLRELSQRSQLLRSALLVTCAYAVMFLALDLIHVNDVEQLSTHIYFNFIINGILLLFTYPLLFILEKTFGFTSNVTLVELSNINNKLMRQMSEVAPGTFQHSLQLANLTAAAANRIEANSQLVRTGAMYHDIGKMLNPAFFTENQSGVNPHDQLSYIQSAQVVISHVTDGMKLAEKYNLPQVIKDFICTHHGKGLTKYFYISYQNEHPDEEVDKELFRYPGPNPFTKEQAILMMADSVEAASRSLPEYTEESIYNLVDKIIDTQVQEGYFKECPITFKDIATIKSVFKEKLKTMYHTRISYPELKK